MGAVSTIEIVDAATPAWRETACLLFREYAAQLPVDICYQGLEGELATMPGRYAPPGGRLLIARCGGQVAGCIAMRKIGDGVCEMKRLYVRDAFRKAGVGRALSERLLAEARAAGYRLMKLDTMAEMIPAIRLYESLGFVPTAPYNEHPLEGIKFFECRLSD